MRIHLNIRLLFVTFIIFFMISCAPTNYVYTKKVNSTIHEIKHVLIMIEYLDAKDDIKGFWNFDEVSNLTNQDFLFEIASQMLVNKGYQISDKNLKTSGLIIARDFYMDHYVDKQLQEDVISPPYIVRSVNLDDKNIQGLEILLAELNRPMSTVMADYRGFIKNNYHELTSNINLSNESAILIIQSYKPRVSMLKNLDLGYSVSSADPDGQVAIGIAKKNYTSYAYLIHKGTGDLLWSNKTRLITESNQEKFFRELPLK